MECFKDPIEPPLRISKPKQTIEERRMLDKIRKRNKKERERQERLNLTSNNLVIQNNEQLVIENNEQLVIENNQQ